MKMLRAIAATTLLTVAAGSMGCGYFFHPERRGNEGGTISGTSLVGDLLWLIPGIVPGVIALAIDFSSGAIYYGGGRGGIGMRVDGHGSVAVQLPRADKPETLVVRLVDGKHRVLAHEAKLIGPDTNASVELQVTEEMRQGAAAGEPLFLEVQSPHGSARMARPIAIAL